MKKTRVGFTYKRRRFFVSARKVSGFMRGVGLMFSKKDHAGALLFEFDNETTVAMHSLFVFFPFLAIWLNGKNTVVEMRIVEPFSLSISPKKSFSKVIEIPVNRNYKEIIQNIVGKRKV